MRAEELQLWLITNQPDLARQALSCGVGRIFLDLERLGKAERQKGRNTWLSDHRLEDLPALRDAVPRGKLQVRINPWNPDSRHEIARVLEHGADQIMLPMFRTMQELSNVVNEVAGHAAVIPLIETPEALNALPKIVELEGAPEVFIGLNDLHLALGQNFMFQSLADGTLDRVASTCRAVGKSFGFGGIGRIGQGELPAELILAEHLRLGSEHVILSRSFHQSAGVEELSAGILKAQIGPLRDSEAHLRERTADQIERDRLAVAEIVAKLGTRSALGSRK